MPNNKVVLGFLVGILVGALTLHTLNINDLNPMYSRASNCENEAGMFLAALQQVNEELEEDTGDGIPTEELMLQLSYEFFDCYAPLNGGDPNETHPY